MGSDTELDALAREAEVSIHAPTWGATRLQSQVVTARQFQSTLPHGERPTVIVASLMQCVSIHAPTWGATPRCANRLRARQVSIHAPTWGATFITLFRPVPPKVSIHAPTWGATRSGSCNLDSVEFQSTLPHGERHGVR